MIPRPDPTTTKSSLEIPPPSKEILQFIALMRHGLLRDKDVDAVRDGTTMPVEFREFR